MRLFANLTTGLRSLIQKRRIEQEIDEELDTYIEAAVAHKESCGLDPERARRAALAELGSRNSIKHQVWSSRWESALEGVLQDVRVGLRSLAKNPGFTAVALLSLSLGIGGNAAIFTLINEVLLRNLPVRDPEQLVTFGKAENGGVLSPSDLGAFSLFPWYFTRQLEANPRPFQGIASYGSFSGKVSVRLSAFNGTVATNTPAVLAPANLVSGNYFSVLGAQPMMGRTITPADDAVPGSGAVVVLSHHFWQRSLSSDPAIVGKRISINGTPFDVIGVMPEVFHGITQEPDPADLWTPVAMQSVILQQPSLLSRSGPRFLHMFARLSPQAAKSKASFAQCQNWLLQQLHTGTIANQGSLISATRLQQINREFVPLVAATHDVSSIRSEYGDSLRILMAVVILVLLIACSNLANFLLARTVTRQRETATRLALGSSRSRIIRQSMFETSLLSLAGGLLGLGIAFAATRALIAFVSRDAAYVAMSPTPNLTVLLLTLGISLFTAVLFGLAPAVVAARTEAAGNLSAGARTAWSSGSRAMRFWPKMLVTGQVIISLLLLVCAGLFLRTLRNLENQDYGFECTHLLLAYFGPRLAGYRPSNTGALHHVLLERLSALPGVQSAALALTPPIGTDTWSSDISISGDTPAPKEDRGSILNRVSGQFFETARIPMISGRPITDNDSAGSPKVAVISQTIANHYFPKGDALGRSLTIELDTVKGPWQIVGVARDTKSGSPRDTDPVRMTYIPLAQIDPFVPEDSSAYVFHPNSVKALPREENQDRFAGTILLRTTGDPARTTGDLQAAVAAIDPNLPLTDVATIHERVSSLMTNDELLSTLTGVFSVLALILAAIGLYGLMSYSVARRTNEIGIRLALGAQTAAVRWMILRESVLLLVIGVALGLPITLAATRLIRQQLFGLSTVDPVTLTVAITAVAAMTLYATWLPAHRATTVDPIAALRCD
jgi:predicted permease